MKIKKSEIKKVLEFLGVDNFDYFMSNHKSTHCPPIKSKICKISPVDMSTCSACWKEYLDQNLED